MASANIYVTTASSGNLAQNGWGGYSYVICGYGDQYRSVLTIPSLYSYRNYGVSSVLLSVTNTATSSTSYNIGAEAVRFIVDPSSAAWSSTFNDTCTAAESHGGFYTNGITSTTPGTVTVDGANRARYTFDLTAYANQLTAINGNFYLKLFDIQGSGGVTLPHHYYGTGATAPSVNLAKPQLIITYSDMKTIKYGVNGSWVKCQVYYGVNGVWVPCEVYYGTGGQWKAINNT